MKKCTKCKIEKPLTEYCKDNSTADKLTYYCRDCRREWKKKWYDKNAEKERQNAKEWRENNRERRKQTRREYEHRRYHNDPSHKLKVNVVNYINRGLEKVMQGKWKRSKKAEEILGCTIEQFKEHIEKQFKPGMTWENNTVNGWHLDHITPKSIAQTQEEIYELHHYTNFQPLWYDENIRKSNKLPEEMEA